MLKSVDVLVMPTKQATEAMALKHIPDTILLLKVYKTTPVALSFNMYSYVYTTFKKCIVKVVTTYVVGRMLCPNWVTEIHASRYVYVSGYEVGNC